MTPISSKTHHTDDATTFELVQKMHKQAKGAFLLSVIVMVCATLAVVWTAGSLEKQLLSLGAFTAAVLTAHHLRKTKLNCQELICRLAAQAQ